MLAGDFRKGSTFEYEGSVWTIVDFQHVKPGKGAAFVRTKMKNVIDGKVLERTWNPTEKLQDAVIETKNMTYSYTDGELYYFMDQEYNLTVGASTYKADLLFFHRGLQALVAVELKRQNFILATSVNWSSISKLSTVM